MSETYPSGRVVTNSFDSMGRIASVSSQTGPTQTSRIYGNGFGYNDKGILNRMRLGNGLWESVKFNNQFQTVEVSLGTSANSANRLKLNYDYGTTDNNGNVKSQTISVPAMVMPNVGVVQGFTATQVYAYDELNRLKSAVETPVGQTQASWQQVFDYDRYGNRTVITGQNATTQGLEGPNPEIDKLTNKIKPKANTTEQYLFDASGNMVRDAVGNLFTFDAENHQKSFTQTGTTGPTAVYLYDSDGRRVKKVVGNEVSYFLYDAGGKLAEEYTQNSPQNTNPQTIYMTTDVLDSPRINTNQKGEILSRHDYLPFGDEIVGLGQRNAEQKYAVSDGVRQKFTGYEKDTESGLDFAQARYYGNGLGRFTSVDPAMDSASPGSPQSWNRYSYVLNNPLSLTDSTGMCPDDDPGCVEGGHTRAFNSVSEAIKWYWDNGIAMLASVFGPLATTSNVEERSATNYGAKSNGTFFEPGNQLTRQSFFALGERNRQINEGVKFIDPTGIASLNETTVKASLGHASNSDLAFEYGKFGVNNVVNVFGGEIFGSIGKGITKNVAGDIKTFTNLFPEDVAIAGARREVFFDGNKWRMMLGDTVATPRGTLNFVVQEGKIFVGKANTTHVDLALGKPVEFAGQLRFGRHGNAGILSFWTNGSGHFQPGAQFRHQAPLPQNLFRPWNWEQLR